MSATENSTPISKGDKREASFPLDASGVDSKKTRHLSGDSASSAMEGTDTTDIAIADLDEPVHVLSQPMNPTDIVQMARELRSLMLPEISSLIKSQLPDIKAAIKTEVTEATNTLTSEIQSLRTENDNLRKDIDKLTERLIKESRERQRRSRTVHPQKQGQNFWCPGRRQRWKHRWNRSEDRWGTRCSDEPRRHWQIPSCWQSR